MVYCMPASIVYERSLLTHVVNLGAIVVALLGLGLFGSPPNLLTVS